MLGFHPIAAMPLAAGHVFVYVPSSSATGLLDYRTFCLRKGRRS